MLVLGLAVVIAAVATGLSLVCYLNGLQSAADTQRLRTVQQEQRQRSRTDAPNPQSEVLPDERS